MSPVSAVTDAPASGWRAWAGSLAGRITLVLVAGLLLLQLVPLGLWIYDNTWGVGAQVAESLAGRVNSVVALYEGAPPRDRPALLRAVQSRNFGVVQRSGRPALPSGAPGGLAGDILPRLGPVGERGAEAWSMWSRRGPTTLIAVPVLDGGWLWFSVFAESRPESQVIRPVYWIAVVAVVALFALWAAWRTAAPMRRFAAAADRFGVDVYAPPLPEQGSGELRRAVRAFNRMQERLRRYVDDRTMLLAAVSHDLRTALTRLRLRSELMDKGEPRDKILADLDEMQAMLQASLDFARDAAAAEERTRVDLSALLQALCDDCADAGQDVRYAGSDQVLLEGRPVALRRAFANLIDNAVRYGGEAEVTLEDRGETVDVTVADRGPGIPPDKREQVFAPFRRLETSRSRDTGGTGLGLAVARSAIRAHGGDIAIEERPGGGLVFRASLPRLAPAP